MHSAQERTCGAVHQKVMYIGEASLARLLDHLVSGCQAYLHLQSWWYSICRHAFNASHCCFLYAYECGFGKAQVHRLMASHEPCGRSCGQSIKWPILQPQ